MSFLHVDIVVSRFNEDLKWTLESPFNAFQYIVYNKGDNEDFEKTHVKKIINLNNVGRNDHTYLYHIVQNYDNLNDIIIFFPGSVDMEYKKGKAIDLLNYIKEYKRALFVCPVHVKPNILTEFCDFSMVHWSASYNKNFIKNQESYLYPANTRPFGKWFLENFGDIEVTFYQHHGLLSVDKRDIMQYDKDRYVKLMDQLEVSSNPEVGHYIERSWAAIFHPFLHTNV
jgi:hypothetical protein